MALDPTKSYNEAINILEGKPSTEKLIDSIGIVYSAFYKNPENSDLQAKVKSLYEKLVAKQDFYFFVKEKLAGPIISPSSIDDGSYAENLMAYFQTVTTENIAHNKDVLALHRVTF